MKSMSKSRARRLVFVAAVVLFLLHQDFWFWDSTTPVFGFLPIGLAYHALYSVLAACLWAAAVKFAWPEHIERFAEGLDEKGEEPAKEGTAP